MQNNLVPRKRPSVLTPAVRPRAMGEAVPIAEVRAKQGQIDKATAKTPSQKLKEELPPETTRVQRILTRGEDAASRALAAVMTEASGDYEDSDIGLASEAHLKVVGIPFPSLAIEFLFGVNVLPLGRSGMVVGLPGTCKSALTFEMARWFRICQGCSTLLENEDKYSEGLAVSILGYDDPYAMGVCPCHYLEDWQEKSQYFFQAMKEQMIGNKTKKIKGTGRTWPYLQILDSLSGKLSLETADKIESEGSANRSHPVEALKNSLFLKKVAGDMTGYPFFFVFTNHLKPSKDASGNIIRNKAGGKAADFGASFELEMRRIKPIEKAKQEGLMLEIRCYKNGMGSTFRRIQTDILWWYEKDEKGELKQHTVWDWYGATVNLIVTCKTRRDELREIVDVVKINNNKFYSKRLGVPKDKPVSKSKLGELIQADESLLSQLRDFFGIINRKVFKPGVDYRKQKSPNGKMPAVKKHEKEEASSGSSDERPRARKRPRRKKA